MATKTEVTLSKGGFNQRTIKAGDIVVPDLWHLAMELKKGSKLDQETSKMVLECWNLAHDMKRHIQES